MFHRLFSRDSLKTEKKKKFPTKLIKLSNCLSQTAQPHIWREGGRDSEVQSGDFTNYDKVVTELKIQIMIVTTICPVV